MILISEVMEMKVEQEKRFGAPERTSVIVIGVVLALLLVGLLGGGMMGPGMMVAGPLLVIAGVLFVVWLVVGGRLPSTDAAAGGPGGDGAQAILRERYPRGELTHEQYEQMHRDLG